MKTLIISATLAVSSLFAAGAEAAPAPTSLVSSSETSAYIYEYHVMYYDCDCGHWKCYGTYTSKCKATPVAEKLAARGYKVRIDVEHI